MIRRFLHSLAKRVALLTAPREPLTDISYVDAGSVDPRMCGLVDIVKSGWYNNATGELIAGFDIQADDLVLDLGCGEGGASLFCARRGATVFYADMEAEKLHQARKKINEIDGAKGAPLLCDGGRLPLADNALSKIIAMEILEHTENPQAVLDELARVGRPGALYLLTVPHPDAEKLQQGIAPDAFFRWPNHIKIFSEEEFESMVANAGLKIMHTGGWGFYWTFALLIFWITERSANQTIEGAALDRIAPPYHALMHQWAALWQALIASPSGEELKHRLDRLLPKSMYVVAVK